MNRWLILLYLTIISIGYPQIASVRTLFVEKEYTISAKDQQSLLNITSNNSSVIRIIVPIENRETFKVGTKIFGSSLTNGTVIITGEAGVTILNGENAFRTKSAGSQWTLTKVKNNFWLLDGDLYSVDIEAYVGDDVVISAKVDPVATSPFVFAWYKNGKIIQGNTQASLKLINVQISDSGNYKVEVKNNKGYTSSEITSLLVR